MGTGLGQGWERDKDQDGDRARDEDSDGTRAGAQLRLVPAAHAALDQRVGLSSAPGLRFRSGLNL